MNGHIADERTEDFYDHNGWLLKAGEVTTSASKYTTTNSSSFDSITKEISPKLVGFSSNEWFAFRKWIIRLRSIWVLEVLVYNNDLHS